MDGPIHQYQPEEDAIRQEFLEALGFRVLRFTNEKVMDDLDEVLSEIRTALDPSPILPENGDTGKTPPSTFLLHGVTGSGKTEIYLRAIERVLQQGTTGYFPGSRNRL